MNNNNRKPIPSEDEDRDELRARFTGWLDTMLYRAKLKYIDKHRQAYEVVSLDEIPAELIEDPVDYYAKVEQSNKDFDFEEGKLSRVFSELPLMRREVLRLLFAEEKTPEEISHQLHCSVNYVHLQKSRALKKLRSQLMEGGDSHDKG